MRCRLTTNTFFQFYAATTTGKIQNNFAQLFECIFFCLFLFAAVFFAIQFFLNFTTYYFNQCFECQSCCAACVESLILNPTETQKYTLTQLHINYDSFLESSCKFFCSFRLVGIDFLTCFFHFCFSCSCFFCVFCVYSSISIVYMFSSRLVVVLLSRFYTLSFFSFVVFHSRLYIEFRKSVHSSSVDTAMPKIVILVLFIKFKYCQFSEQTFLVHILIQNARISNNIVYA